MTTINLSLLFPNMKFDDVNDILQTANTYITKNSLWKDINRIRFSDSNIETIKDVDIEPVKPWISNLINKLRFNLPCCENDTMLLHAILFIKEAKKKGYLLDELPLLIKPEDCNYNPILYESY